MLGIYEVWESGRDGEREEKKWLILTSIYIKINMEFPLTVQEENLVYHNPNNYPIKCRLIIENVCGQVIREILVWEGLDEGVEASTLEREESKSLVNEGMNEGVNEGNVCEGVNEGNVCEGVNEDIKGGNNTKKQNIPPSPTHMEYEFRVNGRESVGVRMHVIYRVCESEGKVELSIPDHLLHPKHSKPSLMMYTLYNYFCLEIEVSDPRAPLCELETNIPTSVASNPHTPHPSYSLQLSRSGEHIPHSFSLSYILPLPIFYSPTLFMEENTHTKCVTCLATFHPTSHMQSLHKLGAATTPAARYSLAKTLYNTSNREYIIVLGGPNTPNCPKHPKSRKAVFEGCRKNANWLINNLPDGSLFNVGVGEERGVRYLFSDSLVVCELNAKFAINGMREFSQLLEKNGGFGGMRGGVNKLKGVAEGCIRHIIQLQHSPNTLITSSVDTETETENKSGMSPLSPMSPMCPPPMCPPPMSPLSPMCPPPMCPPPTTMIHSVPSSPLPPAPLENLLSMTLSPYSHSMSTTYPVGNLGILHFPPPSQPTPHTSLLFTGAIYADSTPWGKLLLQWTTEQGGKEVRNVEIKGGIWRKGGDLEVWVGGIFREGGRGGGLKGKHVGRAWGVQGGTLIPLPLLQVEQSRNRWINVVKDKYKLADEIPLPPKPPTPIFNNPEPPPPKEVVDLEVSASPVPRKRRRSEANGGSKSKCKPPPPPYDPPTPLEVRMRIIKRIQEERKQDESKHKYYLSTKGAHDFSIAGRRENMRSFTPINEGSGGAATASSKDPRLGQRDQLRAMVKNMKKHKMAMIDRIHGGSGNTTRLPPKRRGNTYSEYSESGLSSQLDPDDEEEDVYSTIFNRY